LQMHSHHLGIDEDVLAQLTIDN